MTSGPSSEIAAKVFFDALFAMAHAVAGEANEDHEDEEE